MLQIDRIGANFHILKGGMRTRLVDARGKVYFSWGAISDRKNARQSACRVRAGEWDSGWIQREQMWIQYGGAPLPEGVPIEITVEIRDNFGETAIPGTEIFYNARADWRAGWIVANEDVRGRAVYFRREFSAKKPVARAILYACGIGYHALFLNGRRIGGAKLDPAHTDYTRECQYIMEEIALEQGENCLSAIVGEGWRRNDQTLHTLSDGREVRFNGIPQLTAMLKIAYSDGSTEWLYTDSDWQAGAGAIANNDLFNGETFDARRAVPDWNRVGFTGFSAAKEVDSPGGRMEPMIVEPIVECEAREPVAIWNVGGAWMIDFGENIAGVVRLRLPEELVAGQTIRIRHSEELEEDGKSLFTAPLRGAKAEDIYIASGDARDLRVWQPEFTYHGFRYARIDGVPALSPKDVQAVSLRTDMDKRAFFRCGSALVTRIHDLAIATERANQHGILTDCPQRDERQGWMNDATVRFQETPYNFDFTRMFEKIVGDLIGAQSPDGAITCTAPYIFGCRPADPVCSSFLMAAFESYRHGGNLRLLKNAYPHLCAWEKYLLSRSEGFIVNYSYYGDWAAPVYACITNESGEGAQSATTPGIFMSTGYSYLNCRILEQCAEVLGENPAFWHDMAEKIRRAMLEKWYHSETARIATGSQGCQAFALWLKIIPEQDAPRAAKLLRDDLVSRDYRFTTGNLTTLYMLEMLTEYGYVNEAWNLITREDYPSYGFMIQQEATTVWERFELKKNPEMNSHSHPMFGSIDKWLQASICGVYPTGAGWTEFAVRPHFPEKLMSAQTAFETPLGEIAVRWFKRYGETHLHVTVPFGARAKVAFGGETHEIGSGFHDFAIKL